MIRGLVDVKLHPRTPRGRIGIRQSCLSYEGATRQEGMHVCRVLDLAVQSTEGYENGI